VKTLQTCFRICNFKLPIETGRWNNVPRELRTCTLCNNEISDEFHYLCICEEITISSARKQYSTIIDKNCYKYFELFNTANMKTFRNVYKFIKAIRQRVTPPGSTHV